MKRSVKDMVTAANAEIETLSQADASALLNDENHVFIDIRDIRELQMQGKIAGAIHAPRGMIEFWVDPDSPYHKTYFAEDKKFIFYCASAWRSALTTQTLQNMGLGRVCHLEGGFMGWKEAGLPIEALPPRNTD